MDAIILAGGKGTRMRPLTNSTPKPLLHVQGKPILEWSLMSLPREKVNRVLIVVKYLKEQIADYMAQQTLFTDYQLVEQLPEPLGTGHALQCCQPYLQSAGFLVVNGDDLYSSEGLAQLAQVEAGILTLELDDASQFGVVVTGEDGGVVRLHEKPEPGLYPPPVKVNIGAYKFPRSIFDYQLQKSARGEYEITDYVTCLAQDKHVQPVVTDFWLTIGTPEALDKAQSVDLSSRIYQGF